MRTIRIFNTQEEMEEFIERMGVASTTTFLFSSRDNKTVISDIKEPARFDFAEFDYGVFV